MVLKNDAFMIECFIKKKGKKKTDRMPAKIVQ